MKVLKSFVDQVRKALKSFVDQARLFRSDLYEYVNQTPLSRLKASERNNEEISRRLKEERAEEKKKALELRKVNAGKALQKLITTGTVSDLELLVLAAQSQLLTFDERDLAWNKALELNGGVRKNILDWIKPAPQIILPVLTPKGKLDVANWISTASAEEIQSLYEKAIDYLCLKSKAAMRLTELRTLSAEALYELRDSVAPEHREAWLQKMSESGMDLPLKKRVVWYFAGSSPKLVAGLARQILEDTEKVTSDYSFLSRAMRISSIWEQLATKIKAEDETLSVFILAIEKLIEESPDLKGQFLSMLEMDDYDKDDRPTQRDGYLNVHPEVRVLSSLVNVLCDVAYNRKRYETCTTALVSQYPSLQRFFPEEFEAVRTQEIAKAFC